MKNRLFYFNISCSIIRVNNGFYTPGHEINQGSNWFLVLFFPFFRQAFSTFSLQPKSLFLHLDFNIDQACSIRFGSGLLAGHNNLGICEPLAKLLLSLQYALTRCYAGNSYLQNSFLLFRLISTVCKVLKETKGYS